MRGRVPEDRSDGIEEEEEEAGVESEIWVYTQPQRRGGQRNESPAVMNGIRMF
jgi:hypothetical protein